MHQEVQRCWVFHAQRFPMCIKSGPPSKGHPANLTQLWEALETTWASIPVERFWHLVESMPWGIEAVLRAKGEGVQLNIRKVFLMFSIFSWSNWWIVWSNQWYNHASPCYSQGEHQRSRCTCSLWGWTGTDCYDRKLSLSLNWRLRTTPVTLTVGGELYQSHWEYFKCVCVLKL